MDIETIEVFQTVALEVLIKKTVHFDQLRHWPKANVNKSTSSNMLLDYLYIDVTCNSKDDTNKQCSCISIAVPSKKEWFGKKEEKQHEGYYKDFSCLLTCLSKMKNLK